MGETGDEVIDEEDPVTADSDNEDVSEEEFKKRALLMKEKKITFQRASNINHKEMTTFQHIQIALGIYWYKNKIKREKYSKVFPWLYVGDKTMAANLTFLAGQGFTHILNVTKEVKNYFGEKFVYLRLSVADKENENLSVRYTKAFQFIQRVVASKGKLFVHCTAGSSRAPAIVIAYLIAIRKIPLFDALEYMTAVRTCVCPNLGFLYQLAELEAKEGMGSSVLYNKRWDKMYDFNKLRRGMNLERRATAGERILMAQRV
ncbi:SSH1 [Symbiodinium microadriaticum]|nr:SSH1 [Symbiodinium microadriaticum]